MIYKLTEWDGRGSGESSLNKTRKEAMKQRKCTLTLKKAFIKYGKDFLRVLDVKCTTIDSYMSKNGFLSGNPKTTKTWY